METLKPGVFTTPDEPSRIDDAIFEGRRPGPLEEHKPGIIVAERIEGQIHTLDEKWLRSRVRGFMHIESPELDFWVGCYTREGKWIYCSSRADAWHPSDQRVSYALKVCQYVNKHLAGGGAWLVGWIRGGRTFYLLWKDADGDIQIPIEAEKPFAELATYRVDHWLQHCAQAVGVWAEWKKNLELGRGQDKKLAQGEAVSKDHLKEAPAIGL